MNKDQSNLQSLEEIQKTFESVSEASNFESIGISKNNIVAQDTVISNNEDKPIIVNVKDSIAKLFDPDLQPCPLPEKILKKLKKLKADKQNWVPKELAGNINGMPDMALYFKGKDLPLILHTIRAIHKDNRIDTLIVLGAQTAKDLVVSDYIWPGINNFGYTLDCSGFLNASIEGTATVPGSDITTKAGAAVEKQKSLFIGGGVIISPLYAAYYGESSGINMSKTLRLQILTAIINSPEVNEGDILELIMSFEVIWASSKGEQGFNGSSNITAKGSVGIGVAQISGSTNISGTVSRKSNFAEFDTYLTGRQRLNSPSRVSVSMIKTKITELK